MQNKVTPPPAVSERVRIVNYTPHALVATSKLHKHPDNPNVHPRVQIDALCEVLIENGWRSPVVVSKRSGLVIKGHGRIEAAERLGVAVPVEYQDYPDEAAEIRDLIADNKIQELSQLDDKTVSALVSKFKIKGGIGMLKTQSGLLHKSLQQVAAKAPAVRKFPILVLESEEQRGMFDALMEKWGAKTEAALFGKILKRFYIEEFGEESEA